MHKLLIVLLMTVSTLLAIGRANAQVQYQCDGGAGIYLYEHPNYQGRCVRFTLDEADLRRLAFDDQASSLRLIGNWRVTLYRDPGRLGVATTFTEDQADFFDTPVGDNQTTSIRVRLVEPATEQSCDGEEGVYLYEHPDYQGRCVKFTQDVPDLRRYDFNDLASSVAIIGDWTVVLARDLDGTGIVSAFTQDDPNFFNDPVGDNQVTSLLIQQVLALPPENICDGEEGVYLYEHPNYQGRCIKFTRNAQNLRDYSFDNIASSVRIRGNWRVMLNTSARGVGLTSIFTGDDPNLADDRVGDNRVSSLYIQRR